VKVSGIEALKELAGTHTEFALVALQIRADYVRGHERKPDRCASLHFWKASNKLLLRRLQGLGVRGKLLEAFRVRAVDNVKLRS
jgi:hypothetical protein